MNESTEQGGSTSQPRPSTAQRRLLVLLLFVTFLRGVLYLAIMPPWQHYDEPTHFEYIRLLVERRRIPQVGDVDLELRREIAASMQSTNFWEIMGLKTPTIDPWSDKPPGIGYSELNHPPLYYAVLAVPQFLVMEQDIETQLYVARLTSVLLYVVVVGATFGLLRDAFPARRWLPLAAALFVTLLPPITDLMSAVNNDVGAITAVTLLIWASVRVLRYGLSVKRILTMILAFGACLYAKNTATVVGTVIVLLVGLTFVPRKYWRWLAVGVAALVLVALAISITWGGHAASWYSKDPPTAPNRVSIPAPLGDWALGLSSNGETYPRTVLQELQHWDGIGLRGKTATMGLWLKGAQEMKKPVLISLEDRPYKNMHWIPITTAWQFHAFTTTVSTSAAGLSVFVEMPSGSDEAQTVYADGLVVVEGEMPLDETPRFDSNQAKSGQWGGQAFKNLLRNPSAESAWPGLRDKIGSLRLYRQPIVMIFHSVIDWTRTKWVYLGLFVRLHNSFWGRLSWSQVMLPTIYDYPLAIVVFASIVGCIMGLIRRIRSDKRIDIERQNIWILFAGVCLMSWGMASLRIHPVFKTFSFNWPMARYAAVAIVPTSAFLILGLSELAPRRWKGWLGLAGLVGMIILDMIIVITVIIPHYYG